MQRRHETRALTGSPGARAAAVGSLLLAAVLLLVTAGSALAQPKTPKALVQDTVDRALAVLRDPKLQGIDKRKERFAKVHEIVSAVFDWEDMARRSLGVHWRSIDDAQRKRYVELFKELLADRYMEDINRFRGNEQVLVHDMHKDGEDYRVDTTVVTHSREKVPINYFLHAEGDSYRIHDFSVEGVSLVNHYRKSFSRFLVNKDFGALITKLESKAAKNR
jgi:phospholipid transport system substrate-binding protein